MDMKSALELRVGDLVNIPHMGPKEGWRVNRIMLERDAALPSGRYPLFRLVHNSKDILPIGHITYRLLQEVK